MTDEIKILTEDDSDAWTAQLKLEENYERAFAETVDKGTLHLPSNPLSKRHGSAEDRGSADSYYGRPFTPHYYVGDSYNSSRIELKPTDARYELYEKGYQEQVDHKDWG